MSGLFNLPPRSTKAGDSLLAKKSTTSAKPNTGVTIKGGGGLLERIATINAAVAKNLGKYADNYDVIRGDQKKEFSDYIDKCILNGEASIDTETDGLDPITCTLAGISLFTRSCRAIYVPIHHVSYVTGQEVDNQLDEKFVAEQLQRLADAGVRLKFFNAKFDIRVVKNQLGVMLTAWWDGYLAARLLNENEGDGNNGLKPLHKKYCLHGEGDAFTFEALFSGIPFTHIPVKTGYIYAARDAEITDELCEFQRPYLTPGTPECTQQELEGVAWVFRNIEMACVPAVVEMEETGIAIDVEYAKQLSEKYNATLLEKEQNVFKVCDSYRAQIDEYKKKSGAACKIGDPINVNSPPQMAVLLYDILKIGVIDKKNPRGTGEEILSKVDHPIAKAILDYREFAKLISTYVDKMPKIVNKKTGRIHSSLNQIGAGTGRTSSSDPNMQNIPSHNKDIRPMFVATEGYVLMSSDYSAQEPRLTAHMSKDVKMIQAYRDGKDLYVEIASLAFDMPYDECKEFRADGTLNPAGKERRGMAKVIVLGVCYGKGVPAIADDLKITVKKAQEVYDKIMTLFPGLKQFMEDSENMARTKGYVTTAWGRKRRLPNMQLPLYEFTLATKAAVNFDPLFDEDEEFVEPYVSEADIEKYTRLLERCRRWSEKEHVRAVALEHGIKIKDNGGLIAEATRQCVNARIQGSAADQTKLAMILIHHDTELRGLGFRLLLNVHDELIGEAPKVNAKRASERFAELMVLAAKDLSVPSKCDVEITERWYGESLQVA